MGKRGPKPKPRELICWSPNFAYVVGLIATDGCLYNDGRHINFTSKDLPLIHTFKNCLGLTNRIGMKSSASQKERRYGVLQFGDVSLYAFLVDIGITPAKSKTLGPIAVPDKFMPDLVRGLFDGDGSFYSYHDPRWPTSFLFYLSFNSASKRHLVWLRDAFRRILCIKGHGLHSMYGSRVFQLKYAKTEARKIIRFMYYQTRLPCLERKREKIYNALKFDK